MIRDGFQRCTHCGSPDAVILFQVCRCPNEACRLYDRKTAEEVERRREAAIDAWERRLAP